MPQLRVRVQKDFKAAGDIAVYRGILLFSQTLLFSQAIRQNELSGTGGTDLLSKFSSQFSFHRNK